ncbi:hypothetical protein ACWDO5_35405, partial [Streptomyces sp. NPDC000880]
RAEGLGNRLGPVLLQLPGGGRRIHAQLGERTCPHRDRVSSASGSARTVTAISTTWPGCASRFGTV